MWVTQERLKGRKSGITSETEKPYSSADFKENDNRHPCSFKYQKPSVENPLSFTCWSSAITNRRARTCGICPDTFPAADKAHKIRTSPTNKQQTFAGCVYMGCYLRVKNATDASDVNGSSSWNPLLCRTLSGKSALIFGNSS